MSELLLVPVPGTSDTGAPLVRVVVVPRLTGGDTLADHGLADWPGVLSQATFEVEVEVAGSAAQTISVSPQHEADPAVWQSFFGSITVADVSPPSVPDAPEVTATTGQVEDVEATYRAAANAELDADAAVHPDFDSTVVTQLQQRWADEPEPVVLPPGAAPAPAEVDFHRALGVLREHPAVMRSLGLVFDLPVTTSLGGAGTVRVRWPAAPAGLPTPVSPATAYEVHAERGLLPASQGTVRGGLLDLSDTDAYQTTTLDVDGAVQRLHDAARAVGGTAVEAADPIGLPALRTAGIVLMRRGRAGDIESRRAAVAANAELESLEAASPLRAEDLMLGLRVDVRFKGSDDWKSLCRRDASYTVDGQQVRPSAEEEGHVKNGAAVRHSDGVLRADEIVSRWFGWSLAAPQQRPDRRRDGVRPASEMPFDFGWEFGVPERSLLPLRFGRDYHLRARVADLAGGGVPPEDQDVAAGTEPVPYVRHQPVGSPLLRLAEDLDPADLGPGGGIDLLVIRSDAPDYPRNDARLAGPPTTTLDVAEQHGRLDGDDQEAFDRVLRALAGELPDPASEGMTVFPVPEPGGLDERRHLLGWRGTWPEAHGKRIVLEPRTGDEAAIVPVPAQDLVRVRLAPAEQLTLALSSFIPDDVLPHLAMTQWRAATASSDVVKNGRHPMATPERRITLVHAVRRPLGVPTGSLQPERTPGASSAVLVPSLPLMGVDTASTVQVQVTASWEEVDDDARTPVVDSRVQDLPVARGDQALVTPIVHELGDTRHRRITYALSAVSRFRHLYRPAPDESDDQFVVRGDLETVSVPSTVRPPPLAIRAVVPSFRSTTAPGQPMQLTRTSCLRVELLRPWHLTGDGEQLAVVVEDSEAARDPIWSTTPVDRMPPVTSYASDGVATVPTTDGRTVTVAAFDAGFVGEHWVADVDLSALAETSYRPFVRLAVARYQAESLPGLELSEIVHTDLVQLMPKRTLTVEAVGSEVRVTLTGKGPDGPRSNRVDVVLEQGGPGAADAALSVLGPDAQGLPAWTPVTTATGTLGAQMVVAVPAGLSGGTRLRVREVESPGSGAEPASGTTTAAELNERVVYTELVSLSA